MKPIIYTQKCTRCDSKKEIAIPEDLVKFFASCGLKGNSIARIYTEYKTNNIYFYSWIKTTCDICGKKRVLGWQAGNSPPSTEIIYPSSEIRFWPNYDFPPRKIRVCKWCMPDNDSKDSIDNFTAKLYDAMKRKNQEVFEFKNKP
jgi:hypothetical protein